jgi:hypothetical protein
MRLAWERFLPMRRIAAGVVVVSLAFLTGAVSAHARGSSFTGGVNLSIKGWGTVKPGRGFALHSSVLCRNATCSAALFARAPHVVLTAKPSAGWTFLRWRGPCARKTTPKCTVNLRRVHADGFGQRIGVARAMFVPTAPGLSRANPIPLGTAASTGPFVTVRVNSATPNVQLEPAAPTSTEYFAANLTVTYTGPGTATAGGLSYPVVGRLKTPYGPFANACPDPGPQPPLELNATLHSGQSTSGYVCWTIATTDESSLELYFGSGTFAYPGTTWFALH